MAQLIFLSIFLNLTINHRLTEKFEIQHKELFFPEPFKRKLPV